MTMHPTKNQLSQTKYARDIQTKANMQDCKPCITPSGTNTELFPKDSEPFDQPSLYRSLIGGLQYLTLTRPDLFYSVNKLSQFLQAPTQSHWKACKRILRYIKGTLDHGFFFLFHKIQSPVRVLF